VFELKDDTPAFRNKLEKIVNKNFTRFASGVRQSEGLKIYLKKGKKLVVE